jgi:hypothetical protein
MEWWWLLIAVPLFNLWKALSEAWKLLQVARTETQRKFIIERAGASAFINSVLTITIAVAPWPYKIIGFLPALLPILSRVLNSLFGIRLRFYVW